MAFSLLNTSLKCTYISINNSFDFETASLHYVGGVGRKYVLVLGTVAMQPFLTQEYISGIHIHSHLVI